jgi:hypothetical protein
MASTRALSRSAGRALSSSWRLYFDFPRDRIGWVELTPDPLDLDHPREGLWVLRRASRPPHH